MKMYFLKGIQHISSDYAKDYYRYSSYLNSYSSLKITNDLISLKRGYQLKKEINCLYFDNTLWKGILGDDLKSGIKMDSSDPIEKFL